MKFKISEIEDIRAFWQVGDEIYNYVVIDETIKANKKANTLRLTLRDKDYDDDADVEVIFIQDEKGIYFRQEDYEKKYRLKRFDSEDEIILYYEDIKETEFIYFHLFL